MTDKPNAINSADTEANPSDLSTETGTPPKVDSNRRRDSKKVDQPQAKAQSKTPDRPEFSDRNPGWVEREI
jgi:hypothetical protein